MSIHWQTHKSGAGNIVGTITCVRAILAKNVRVDGKSRRRRRHWQRPAVFGSEFVGLILEGNHEQFWRVVRTTILSLEETNVA